MREQPIRLSDRRNYGPGVPPPSALPLTELEMDVLIERRFYRLNPRRSAPGWVAHNLGITKAEVLTTETEADAHLRDARPIVEPPSDTSAQHGLGYDLWRLSRLEHFALVGTYKHEDIRDQDVLQIADDDAKHVRFYAKMPDHIESYAWVLYLRARQRCEDREQPALGELERRRWDRERELIDLWTAAIVGPARDVTSAAYPTTLPLIRAEEHLHWLAGELQDLQARAAARIRSDPPEAS